MKNITVITLALFSISAQGCVADIDAMERENVIPPMESPGPDDENDIAAPIAPALPPEENNDGLGEEDILNPVEIAPAPEGDDGDGDDEHVEGIGVGDDNNDDDELRDDDDDGAFGDSEGEDDGDADDQDDNDELEIGDECEPGQNQCEIGFDCQETCVPSVCDDDGRCTADCQIVFACIGHHQGQ